MSELEEEWARVLLQAEQRARAKGRGDVVEYLALRASNDEARRTGIEWLFATFTEYAGEANRAGSSVQITKADAHRFRSGNSTMVGTMLTFRLGVRALMIEAGWPRAPLDGIVRGGGLALAHIRHLGLRAADEELLLMRSTQGAPQWFILEKTGTRAQLFEARVRQHIRKFLGAT